MPKGDSDDVFTITEAQRGRSDEQTGRQRRYLISMGIRTACVVAAIIVPGWAKWVFIIGAVVLPYLAVVIANAGPEADEPGDVGVAPTPHTALPGRGIVIEPPRADPGDRTRNFPLA